MFHALRTSLKARVAESLIETLVAVAVISITTTASLSLIRSSLVTNEVIGEKLIAMNLGLEALEAMRNIRDTNYLRFSGNPDECWNTINVVDIADCADPGFKLTEGTSYHLHRIMDDSIGPVFSWALHPVADADVDGWVDLFSYEIDLDADPAMETLKMYAQHGAVAPDISVVEEKAFYRTITVTYWPSRDAYDATVTIEWEAGGNPKSMTLTRTIAHIF